MNSTLNIKSFERHLAKLMSEHKSYETIKTIWEQEIPVKDKNRILGHWLSAAQDYTCSEDFLIEGLPVENQICGDEDGKLQLIMSMVYCGRFDLAKKFFNDYRYGIPETMYAQGLLSSVLLLDASEVEAAGYLSFLKSVTAQDTEVFFYWLSFIFNNKATLSIQDAVDLLTHKFPKMNVQYVLLQLSRIYLKDLAAESFLKIRTPDDLFNTPIYQQITDDKFVYDENLENPSDLYSSISKQTLKTKVETMMSLSQEVLSCPVISAHLDKIRDIAKTNEVKNMCQILSTGRAGTYSLNILLNQSTQSHFGWHSLQYTFHPNYRRKLMAYLLSDVDIPLEDLKEYVRSYLYARTAEIVGSFGAKRIPVIINHWDVIFSPILAKIFPEMNFLSITRDVKSYFFSAYSKQQWGNYQTEPLLFDNAQLKANGKFVYCLDKEKSYEYKIAWFSAFTDKLGVVMQELIPDRVTIIKAEDIFKREPATIESLRHALHMSEDDLSNEALEAHYEQVINEKSEKARYSKEELREQTLECQRLYEELSAL